MVDCLILMGCSFLVGVVGMFLLRKETPSAQNPALESLLDGGMVSASKAQFESTVKMHEVCCDVPGCRNKVRMRVAGEMLADKLAEQGWKHTNASDICPAHEIGKGHESFKL